LRRWSARLNLFTTVKAEVAGRWVLPRVDIHCAALHRCQSHRNSSSTAALLFIGWPATSGVMSLGKGRRFGKSVKIKPNLVKLSKSTSLEMVFMALML